MLYVSSCFHALRQYLLVSCIAHNGIASDKNSVFAKLLHRVGIAQALNSWYLHQVFSGKRNPSRSRLICMCIGMQATLEETQELLKLCGCAQLYPKNKRDAIILFGITHGKDLFEINDILFEEEEETLY